MFHKDAEEFINKWKPGEAKVFYYYDHWYWKQKETIILHRVDSFIFKTVKDKSTVNPGNFNDTQLLKLLTNELLVERPYDSVNTNYMNEKTGGCTCGTWITFMASVPDAHAVGCPRSNKRK